MKLSGILSRKKQNIKRQNDHKLLNNRVDIFVRAVINWVGVYCYILRCLAKPIFVYIIHDVYKLKFELKHY